MKDFSREKYVLSYRFCIQVNETFSVIKLTDSKITGKKVGTDITVKSMVSFH